MVPAVMYEDCAASENSSRVLELQGIKPINPEIQPWYSLEELDILQKLFKSPTSLLWKSLKETF